jgi:MYXO-CTERM domain-containing protein
VTEEHGNIVETPLGRLVRLTFKSFPLLIAWGHLACSSVDDQPGVARGRFVENIARFEDGRSEVSYTLFRGEGRNDGRELVFTKAPDLVSNTEIKVWGTETLGRIAVDRYEVVGDAPAKGGPIGTSREALIDAAAIEPTNMVMVMVDTGGGLDMTIEEMNAELFSESDPTSLVHYYLENSYGMHTLTGQVAPGTYQYSLEGCDYEGLTQALMAQVHADTGVPEFDLYLWYFPQTSACEWSGLSSGTHTFYNGSSGCVVLAQEPGHSFGLAHSSSLTCTDASGATVAFADDPQASCVHSEYGNGYDTMGGGCRHFSGYQKVYRTYLQGCNVAQVNGSGTFTLHPIESACNGVQVIQVPMPKVRPFSSSGGGSGDRTTNLAFYNVELRAPIGAFDGSSNAMVPSVLVNAAPDWRVFGQGGGGRGRGNTRGEHIWLLDMAPTSSGTSTGGGRGQRGGNGSGHALALGQTFTDPAGGVSITTEAVSATSATIRVDITTSIPMGGAGGASGTGGAGGGVSLPAGTIATCLDDKPLLAPGPADCAGNYAGMSGTTGSGGMAGGGGMAGTGAASAGMGGLAGGNQLAGAGGSTGGAGGNAGTANKVLTQEGELDGGCGCRVPGEPGSNGEKGAFALLAVAVAALLRRRP